MIDGTGWITVHRKLMDHPRFKDPEWLSIWMYLLLNANHCEIKKVWNGKLITLKPGQLITGRFVIAEKTGVHPSKVVRVLQLLKTEQQIEQLANNRCSIITLLNWNEYQVERKKIEHLNGQLANNWRTPSEQLANTDNNVNNVNNENNVNKKEEEEKQKIPPPQFFDLILNNKIFSEQVRELFKINEKKFAGALKKFFRFKKLLQEDTWTSLADCQANFLNWIPSELAHLNGKATGNGKGQPVYTPPPPVPESGPDPISEKELAEKNKQARVAMLRDIEADVVTYSANENSLFKAPCLKFDVLGQEKLIDRTLCELPKYLNKARELRRSELSTSFDKGARIKLRHYDEGRTPVDDHGLLRSYAKEFAYRDYLKKRVDENVLRN